MDRHEFRQAVFERDNWKCVNCGNLAVDAHHLIERRLWPDGGYHLDNGVSLCEECHLFAESTAFTPQYLRERADIRKVILPPSLETGYEYDKWGNPYLSYVTGTRMRGPLFYDESVQKVIKPFLKDFISLTKYPRTAFLPWSARDDEAVVVKIDNFAYEEVVVTEKMDGENTTMYRDDIHARSLDSGYHPSRTWVKNFHSQIAYNIPSNFRICGENMYAEHSLHYSDLPSYFLGFSVWENDTCLSWDETLDWFELLGITPVPVIARGQWEEVEPLCLAFDPTNKEGYVVRLAESFLMHDFQRSVAKWVRPNHVTSDSHWLQGKVTTNELK